MSSSVVPTSVLLEVLAEMPNFPFNTCTPFFHGEMGSSPSAQTTFPNSFVARCGCVQSIKAASSVQFLLIATLFEMRSCFIPSLTGLKLQKSSNPPASAWTTELAHPAPGAV